LTIWGHSDVIPQKNAGRIGGDAMVKSAAGRKHSVRCTVKVPELTKSGTSAKFDVFADVEKIGTIVLDRGSITWFGGKRRTGTQIPWTRFAQMMNDHCYPDRE
jgi:hypothetical protein